jgi:hypothetical protein
MPYQTFLIRETNKISRSLRRYHDSSDKEETCSGPMGYHNASMYLDTLDLGESDTFKVIDHKYSEVEPFIDHPLWPTHCSCGYEFKFEDEWQVFTDILYRRVSTGEEFTLNTAPIGAVWFASWLEDMTLSSYYETNGRGKRLPLVCNTPAGPWVIDYGASNGPGWDVSGEIDDVHSTITAVPSIDQPGRYHGFLTNGILSDDLNQR